MDAQRFDSLARTLHSTSPRRATLGLLLGGALGLAGLAESAAKNKGKGKGKGKGKDKGKKDKEKCKGGCDRCALQTCLNGKCQCPVGMVPINGICGVFPVCRESLAIVSSSDECCSDTVFFDDGGQMRCQPGDFLCLTPFDCADGGPCRGFMCTSLYNTSTGGKC